MTNYCTPSHLNIPLKLLFDVPTRDRGDDKPSLCASSLSAVKNERRNFPEPLSSTLPVACQTQPKHGLNSAALLDSKNIQYRLRMKSLLISAACIIALARLCRNSDHESESAQLQNLPACIPD